MRCCFAQLRSSTCVCMCRRSVAAGIKLPPLFQLLLVKALASNDKGNPAANVTLHDDTAERRCALLTTQS